jgi:hypothetical protein
VNTFTGSGPLCRLYWSTARSTPAVNSGRSVILSPPRLSKEYISLRTTSDDSPTPRTNRLVSSNTAVSTLRVAGPAGGGGKRPAHLLEQGAARRDVF